MAIARGREPALDCECLRGIGKGTAPNALAVRTFSGSLRGRWEPSRSRDYRAAFQSLWLAMAREMKERQAAFAAKANANADTATNNP